MGITHPCIALPAMLCPQKHPDHSVPQRGSPADWDLRGGGEAHVLLDAKQPGSNDTKSQSIWCLLFHSMEPSTSFLYSILAFSGLSLPVITVSLRRVLKRFLVPPRTSFSFPPTHAVSMCYTGPSMSTRRKTMVATWEAPGRSGEIYAELEFDMTNAKKYMEEVS